MSTDTPASPVLEGEIIAGKYRVSRTLGVGGMGVVVAATHIDLYQRVALKFLLPQASAHPELIERFAREARAAAQIQSEHVARVIDVGTLETGAPYMVMEYLEGQDLHQALKDLTRIDVQTAVGYVLHACEAIAEAHVLGIVHRDLKPANLFLAAKPNGTTVVKVLDFGISKSIVISEESALTHASTMVGSPSYMAPEQIKEARSVDARADQWSIGVILYELVSGVKPFQAASMAELIWVILDQPHSPLAAVCAGVPEGLATVIDRCLSKDAAGRFATIAELAQAIAPYGPDWSAASAQRTAHVLGVGLGFSATQAPVARTGLSGTPLPAPGPSRLTPAPTPTPRTDPAVTDAPWSQSQSHGTPAPRASEPPRRPAPVRALLVAGASMLVAGAIMAVVVMTQLSETPDATSLRPSTAPSLGASTPAPARVPTAVPEPPVAVAPPPVDPPAVAAPPLTSTSPAPSTRAATAEEVRPRAQPRTTTTVKPAAAASVTPPATKAPKCTTVSFFDADGVKHFKQECP